MHDIDESDGQTFLAMSFIEGESLRGKVAQRPLPLDDALDYAIQAAAGFVNRQFGIAWSINEPIVCAFSNMNAECLKTECKFYRG